MGSQYFAVFFAILKRGKKPLEDLFGMRSIFPSESMMNTQLRIPIGIRRSRAQ